MEAGNLTGIIPCVILVFRRVAIDAIPFAAVPAEPSRHGLNLCIRGWCVAATQVSFLQIVRVAVKQFLDMRSFPVAGRIRLLGFLLRDAHSHISVSLFL